MTRIDEQQHNLQDTALSIRTCAKLVVNSGAMSSRDVTELLGLEPSTSVIEGEPIQHLTKKPMGRLNNWILSSEGNIFSREIESHVDWLLSMLLPRKTSLLSLQHISGMEMYVHCPWWLLNSDPSAPRLRATQMRDLADLSLDCVFSFADYRESE